MAKALTRGYLWAAIRRSVESGALIIDQDKLAYSREIVERFHKELDNELTEYAKEYPVVGYTLVKVVEDKKLMKIWRRVNA